MSDTPGGPNWIKASDDKWYPPEAWNQPPQPARPEEPQTENARPDEPAPQQAQFAEPQWNAGPPPTGPQQPQWTPAAGGPGGPHFGVPAKSGGNGCLKAFLIGLAVLVLFVVLFVFVAAVGVSDKDGVSNSGDSTTATSNGTRSNNSGSNEAADDVAIKSCGTSDNQFEGPEAVVTVTNHSSKASNYVITLAFESRDGATQLDTTNQYVQALNPNQSTDVDLTSFKSDLRGQAFTCKVTDVTRFAS